MVPYTVELADAAARVVRKLPTAIGRRVVAKSDALSNDPRPAGAVKLSGHELYRLRVGDYRIVYAIDDARRLVTVTLVAHRRDVYRGL
jgi:mRNA interferase RelE/StbE